MFRGVSLFLIAVALLAVRCSFIAKIGHGARRPKIEDEESIRSWVNKKGVQNAEVVTSQPEDIYFFVPAYLNSIFLFNKSGTFLAVGYSQGKFCVANVDKTIAAIKPYHELINKPDSFIISYHHEMQLFAPGDVLNHTKKEWEQAIREKRDSFKLKIDTLNLNLSFLLAKMRSLSGDQYNFKTNDSIDYYLVLPFAKFAGNWSQVRNLKKYFKAVSDNTSSNIQIIFLNLDKQEWWGKKWNEKIQISN
jgi:hypothetical protein